MTPQPERMDWGIEPDPEIDEQYRRDLAEIADAKQKAQRDAATTWVGQR